jgi:hypothetical protein
MGVMGYYISGRELTARAFQALRNSDVVEIFNIKADYEVPIMPAVYETRKVGCPPVPPLPTPKADGCTRLVDSLLVLGPVDPPPPQPHSPCVHRVCTCVRVRCLSTGPPLPPGRADSEGAERSGQHAAGTGLS